MSKILEQIKSNAVPAGVVHSAAKGALPLPPAEMLEILVYLTHNPVFAKDARMTLARWDAESAITVVSDPASPAEVLSYYWMEGNRRPSLMPALIENPAIPESMLMELAGEASREVIGFLMTSKRARNSPAVVEALSINPALFPKELQELHGASLAAEEPEANHETHAAHQAWHQEHAAEIAAAEAKPFELVGEDEEHQHPAVDKSADHPPAAAEEAAASLAASALGFQARAEALQDQKKQITVLQRLSRMNASERVKTAFTGGREERSILIRDGAKIVQNAVLSSPKLSDPEVESFAAAKNVSENVLREIARSRKFMKNYNVVRNMVNNAKCPLDLSLTLIKNLLVYDLKSLKTNKSVPETIRNVAGKLYRQKTNPGGKKEV
jgi:hypothetical protein